jgi:hypothetical protein
MGTLADLLKAAKVALQGILASKKFTAAIATMIVTAAARYGWDVDAETVIVWISPIIAAILGQGIADLNKGAP